MDTQSNPKQRRIMSDTDNATLRRQITSRYKREVKDGEIDFTEVAVWAIRNDLWKTPFEDQVEQCRRELVAAAREEKFTDPDGNKVRSNYCVRREVTKPNGQKYIQTVWAHIDVASHPFMEQSFQQRYEAAVGPLTQAYIDVSHYNKHRRGENPEIPFPLDFTHAVADRLQSTEYKPQDMEGL